MPLSTDGITMIRTNLELIAQGERPLVVTIGFLTDEQHSEISAYRTRHGMPPLESAEVVFMGRHIHNSRVTGDGYTIDDVVAQIEAAMAPTSKVVVGQKMTALRSTVERADGYGNLVKDEAILELTQRRPKAELFSVIPRGDKNKP